MLGRRFGKVAVQRTGDQGRRAHLHEHYQREHPDPCHDGEHGGAKHDDNPQQERTPASQTGGGRQAPALTLPVNLVVTALLLLLARADHLAAADVGLARETVGRGLRWAGVAAGAVAVVYLIAILLPATRDAFVDKRTDLTVGSALYQAFVHVPFGTVLLEEVAFRGVLLAMAASRWGTVRGVVFSSVLFGLWHVLPSASAAQANPLVEPMFGTGTSALVVWAAVSVVATAIGGSVFCWLRLRSGSLLAPAGLHWATNGFGFLGAILARPL